MEWALILMAVLIINDMMSHKNSLINDLGIVFKKQIFITKIK